MDEPTNTSKVAPAFQSEWAPPRGLGAVIADLHRQPPLGHHLWYYVDDPTPETVAAALKNWAGKYPCHAHCEIAHGLARGFCQLFHADQLRWDTATASYRCQDCAEQLPLWADAAPTLADVLTTVQPSR